MTEITQKMFDDLRAEHGNDFGYKSYDPHRELAQTMEQYGNLQLAYASACQDVAALREENAKLRDESEKAQRVAKDMFESKQIAADHCRIAQNDADHVRELLAGLVVRLRQWAHTNELEPAGFPYSAFDSASVYLATHAAAQDMQMACAKANNAEETAAMWRKECEVMREVLEGEYHAAAARAETAEAEVARLTAAIFAHECTADFNMFCYWCKGWADKYHQPIAHKADCVWNNAKPKEEASHD